MKKFTAYSAMLLTTLLIAVSSGAYAQHGHNHDRHDRGRGDRHERSHSPPDYRFDNRYHLNRSYPRHGYVIKILPKRRHVIHYHNRDYFYFGGVWYRPSGPNFVVIRPPIGIIVPILPPVYATVWVNGIAYYYANDIYYVWRPDLNGYEVTKPPVSANAPEPPVMAEELYIYPKKGQSAQQQADDRYACHRWASDQTGYDPTQPPSNLSTAELNTKREDYRRAMKACLEGRGYSVR